MTRFVDGPAKGQTLYLRQTPERLRVVEKAGQWDALDLPTDEPRPGETVHHYRLLKRSGMVHIRKSGGGGGFYPMAEYVHDL